MTPTDVLLLAAASGVALALRFGGPGLRWALQRAERGRLRRACVDSIAQLRPAPFVAVRGRARPVGEPLVSPLGGRPCVAFRVERRRREKRGKAPPVWVFEDDAEQAPDFFLDDGTGRVLVRPRGHARFDFAGDAPGENAEEHVDAFRKRHGRDRASFFIGLHADVSYRETVIEVGQPLLVAGVAAALSRPEADGVQAGYRASARPLELCPGDDDPLYIGDGRRPNS